MKPLITTMCGGIALLLAFQCVNPGGGTETGNPAITAMLYNPDNSPAANAKVCFYRHHDDPRTCRPVDSAWTDNNGRYKKDLDTGTYNILAELDTNATFQDSIIVTEGDTTVPPPDTLRCRGNIRGKVELQGTDDPRTVFILFMGSNTFTMPDTLGNFSATNMAKGKYAVTLLTTLDDYSVMDTSFLIRACVDSVIPEPIVMNYTGIPVPKGLRIEYDTMKQIVTLYWNTPTTGRPVGSYNIYRRNIDSNTVLTLLNVSPVTDTSFMDSTGVQDMTYEYQVAVVDTSASEGVKSAGVNATIVSAFDFIKDFGTQGAGTGQFISANDIVADSEGNYWIVDYNRNTVLKFDSSGSFLSEWEATGFTLGLHSPVGIDIDSNNNIFLNGYNDSSVQKYDSLGSLLLRIDSSGILIQDVSVDDKGCIYFSFGTSSGNQNFISKYNPDGTLNKTWPTNSKYLSPALLVANGKVYCASANDIAGESYLDNVIEIFDTTGIFLSTMHIRRANETGPIDIRDIETDGSQRLYLTDPENGKIRILDETEGYVAIFGVRGTGVGEFNVIRGVAISSNGTIAITDRTKVHVFQIPF